MFQAEGGIVAKAEEQERAEQLSETKSIWFVSSITCKHGETGDRAGEVNSWIMKTHADLRSELNPKDWEVIDA